MYHPTGMLTVAHTREAELMAEACACGLPQPADANAWGLPRRMMTIGIALAVVVIALAFWIA